MGYGLAIPVTQWRCGPGRPVSGRRRSHGPRPRLLGRTMPSEGRRRLGEADLDSFDMMKSFRH